MKYEKLLNLFTLKGDVLRPQFFDDKLAPNVETNSKYPDIRMVVPDSNCNTIMNMESLTVLLSKPIKELKGKYLNLGERFIEAKNLHKLVKVHKALKEKVFMVYDSDHINRPFVFEHHIGEYERLS